MTRFLCINPTLGRYAQIMTEQQLRLLQSQRREEVEKLNLNIVSAETVKSEYPDFDPPNELAFYVDIGDMTTKRAKKILDAIMELD